MKIKRFTLLSLPLLVLGGGIILSMQPKEAKYFPRNVEDKAQSSAQGYLEYMQTIKANKTTGEVDPNTVLEARKQADKLPKGKASLNVNWEFVGPNNAGGRTRALAIDRNNSDHLVAGAVAGGVFESFDAGETWSPYDPDFKVNNISCITQAADGSFYVGTGGHFEGFGRNRGYFFTGSGVHKLTGNGQFEMIVEPITRQSRTVDWATIGNITAHPTNPNKLYVAAQQGFRIIEVDPNGNHTITDPIGLSTPCNDVDVTADGKTLVSYAGGRLYVSQGGDVNFTNTRFSGAGRVECDIAPSNSNIMYASAATGGGCLFNIYRSQDSGLNWEVIGPGGTTFDPFGGNCQGNWDNAITVFPNDPGKIIVGGTVTYRWEQSSIDPAPSNGSWEQIDLYFGSTSTGQILSGYVHPDKHRYVFHSNPDSSHIVYIANDGGVYKSTNYNDAQPVYKAVNFGYGVTQYYDMGFNQNGVVSGGTQDNGTWLLGLNEFNDGLSGIEAMGGDGFATDLSVINPSLGFGSSQYNNFRRIQGIGSTPQNTNISTANIVSTNQFLGGVCLGQCSDNFYSLLHLWESFNHENSLDSVSTTEYRTDFPPIGKYERTLSNGTKDSLFPKYSFKSNNGEHLQTDSLRMITYPSDTLMGGNYLSFFMPNTDTTFIVNFDTITINTSTMTIEFALLDANYSSNFSYGTATNYFNSIMKNLSSSAPPISISVDTTVSGTRVSYFDAQIQFIYKHNFHDQVQSALFTANWPGINTSGVARNEKNIFMTRDALKKQDAITWHYIAGEESSPDKLRSEVLCMQASKDGNFLFAGTSDGGIYRISGLDTLDSDMPESVTATFDNIITGPLAGKCERIGSFAQRSVTAIAINPENPNSIIVSLGNYGGGSTFISRTGNALAANVQFTSIQGTGTDALPLVPTYSIMINKNDTNQVLIGTELGVFSTENAFDPNNTSVAWSEENTGMGRVPVYALGQMQFTTGQGAGNEGMVYAGTHGRGVYKMNTFVGINENNENANTFSSSLNVFPNPLQNIATVEAKLTIASKVSLQIFDIRGKLIKEDNIGLVQAGTQQIKFNASELANGTYIIRLVSENGASSSKFIKQ